MYVYIFYLFVLIQLEDLVYVHGIPYNVKKTSDENGPLVEIEDGKLKGKYLKTRYGREYVGFMSIPYGKPPINEMRFKDPEPVEPWTGVYNAVNEVPECIQKHLHATEVTGSEDCLYLNVYTPQMPNEGDKLLPVMVFIHRGGWMSDSAKSTSYGSNLLLDKDIVLVIPNYRLGAFGFLSTQDEVVPGNMGIKDQVLVLKWVQRNIAKFGGNPNSVTIFGKSAGAGSVHFHMLSPLSKGLFHRAISQSGCALCPWAVPFREAKENTKMLAKSLNCPTSNSMEMVDCLRKINAHDITNNIKIYQIWDIYPLNIFVPVVEYDHPNALITENPRKIIMEGKTNPVNYMIGLTSNDGITKVDSVYATPDILNEFSKNIDEILPLTLGMSVINTKEIKEFYFDGKDVGNNTGQQVLKLYTEALFGSCVVETVKLQKKYGSGETYVYYFDYEGSVNDPQQNKYAMKKYGINQVYDIFYLFPQKTLYDNENTMADIMIEFWTTFAKTGKPTFKNNNVWKPVVSDSVDYLHINNIDNINMESNLLQDKANFWICLRRNNYHMRYINCMEKNNS